MPAHRFHTCVSTYSIVFAPVRSGHIDIAPAPAWQSVGLASVPQGQRIRLKLSARAIEVETLT